MAGPNNNIDAYLKNASEAYVKSLFERVSAQSMTKISEDISKRMQAMSGLSAEASKRVNDGIISTIKTLVDLQKEFANTNKKEEELTEKQKKRKERAADKAASVEKNKDRAATWGDVSGGLKATGEAVALYDVFTTKSDASIGAATIAESFSGMAEASAGVSDILKGNIFTGVAKIVKGIGTTIASWFKVKDKQLEKKIKNLQEQAKVLQKEFEKIGKESEKLYSGDKSDKIGEQIENLEKQRKNLQDQQAAEDAKKKTDKSKMQGYTDQIDATNEQIKDLKDKQIDAIFGEDVATAIDNFAKAYADAWATGNMSAKSGKAIARDMVKSMVTELIKSNISGYVEEFRKRLMTAMEDDKLSGAEQQSLEDYLETMYNAIDVDDSVLAFYKKLDQGATTATSKGVTSMTQDTAEELNGRFTAIQQHTYLITGQLDLLLANSHMIRDYVEEIRTHTSALSGIDLKIGSLNHSIGNIYSRGIPIRES